MKTKNTYELNPLSKIPGGYHLFIKLSNGALQNAHNIKSPFHYVKTIIATAALEGLSVSRVITASDEVVFADGEFTPEFMNTKVKNYL
jgi:hypothetical protein